MISVIIPVLNEARRVASVVRFAASDPLVSEIIVVDDGSHDATAFKADFTGARVITSSMLGKGASMLDGALAAKNPVLVYLDGDLASLQASLIAQLARPVLSGEADFAKASFTRHAGRVTALTARPLLNMFFPELADFSQPLGGIIAVERKLMLSLPVVSDYGVDVALLIDAYISGARITEVQVGEVEHESQSLEALSRMAWQVASVILERAARYSRLSEEQLELNAERRRQARLDPEGIALQGLPERGLVLVALDGIVMPGGLLEYLAEAVGRGEEMADLLAATSGEPDRRAIGAGQVLRGVHKQEIEQAALRAPLREGIVEALVGLRRAGFATALVTPGFQLAADIIRRRVFADLSLSNLLNFRAGQATGQVRLSAPAQPGCSRHMACSGALAEGLLRNSGLTHDRLVAVAASRDDICLLGTAGHSIGFGGAGCEVAGIVDRVVEASPPALAEALIGSAPGVALHLSGSGVGPAG